MVDGEGRIIHSGGKVVKNAAGFLLHQAMVGSCGRLGVVAELTFKVFPAPAAHATVRVDAGDLASSLSLMAAVQRERFDLEAIDLTPPGVLMLRLGGASEATRRASDGPDRSPSVTTRASSPARTMRPCGAKRASCHGFRPDAALVRVPLSLPQVQALDAALAARRRCQALRGGRQPRLDRVAGPDRSCSTASCASRASSGRCWPGRRDRPSSARPRPILSSSACDRSWIRAGAWRTS